MVFAKSWSFVSVILMFLFGVFNTPAEAQWHSSSQGQRNSLIVNRAFMQNGVYTGLQCKEWVQNVVYGASAGAVWLPQNQPNMYEWYGSADVHALSYCPAIYSAGSGSVIQMKWNGVPHTAIVASTDGSGMYWIDCNWNRDTRVTTHYISYSQFSGAVGNWYTVYYVR